MTLDERPRRDKKVQELANQLRDLAFQKGPEAKLPTTRELCVLLKTNSATLNEALEELEQQNIIYRKHKSGIFVSPKLNRKTICVLFFSRLFREEALSPFWTILWAEVSQEMKKRNAVGNEYYSFYMVPDSSTEQAGPEDLPENVLEQIRQKRVHGALTVGMEYGVYEWMARQNIPSVTFAGIGSLMVVLHEENAVEQAMDDLVAHGCQTIGVWIPNISAPGDYFDSPVYQVWQSRLNELHRPVHQTLFRVGESLGVAAPSASYDLYKQGYQLVYGTFATPADILPDGIFIGNDLMTAGALAAFEDLGILVGKDIAVASMANSGSPVLANTRASSLTLLEVNVNELVQKMFFLMEKALDEQSISTLEKFYLPPFLRRVERSLLP